MHIKNSGDWLWGIHWWCICPHQEVCVLHSCGKTWYKHIDRISPETMDMGSYPFDFSSLGLKYVSVFLFKLVQVCLLYCTTLIINIFVCLGGARYAMPWWRRPRWPSWGNWKVWSFTDYSFSGNVLFVDCRQMHCIIDWYRSFCRVIVFQSLSAFHLEVNLTR